MNNEVDKTNQIIDLINEAKNIAIMPSKVAGVDAFAAAVGFYFMLKDENKNVSIIYQGAVPEEFSGIKDVEISSNARQRELLISVDYSGTEAAKVNYSTDSDILHFSISPIDRNFDMARVKTQIKGFDFDLFITIGAQVLDDFGKTYSDLEGEISRADILNIDNTDRNQRYGNINVIDSYSNSLSVLVLNKSIEWGFKVSTRSAEALLKGIAYRKGI